MNEWHNIRRQFHGIGKSLTLARSLSPHLVLWRVVACIFMVVSSDLADDGREQPRAQRTVRRRRVELEQRTVVACVVVVVVVLFIPVRGTFENCP